MSVQAETEDAHVSCGSLVTVPAPRISLLMAVRHGGSLLAEAVESIRNQFFQDWELLVVGDGADAETDAYLSGLERVEPRLLYLRQPARGLTQSLNRAARLAAGEFLARQDADDVSRPGRLWAQVEFLRQHPEVGVLGTACHAVTDERAVLQTMPQTDAEIRRVMIRRNPILHPTVMLRRSLFEVVGGYDDRIPVAQDYDLWFRMAPLTRFANLETPLIDRRLGPQGVSARRRRDRRRAEAFVRWRALWQGTAPAQAIVWAVRPCLALLWP